MRGSAATAERPASTGTRFRIPLGRLVRIVLALAVLVAAAAIYGPQFIYTTSSEAVLNARIITIASPIEGRVATPPPLEGTVTAANVPLLTIDNPLLDRSRLSELEATQARTEAELTGQKRLIEALGGQLGTLQEELTAYLAATVTRLTLA